MIDALVPDVVHLRPGGLRALCGSWIIAVDSPERDAAHLSGTKDPLIWTVLEVDAERTGTPSLAGFSSEVRRDMYVKLRALPGIGRKSALLVLDCGETIDILRAVSGSDSDFFRQVPGLGNKRIAALLESLRKSSGGELPRPLPAPVRAWVEAREALCAAGRSEKEAEAELFGSSGSTAEELLAGAGL